MIDSTISSNLAFRIRLKIAGPVQKGVSFETLSKGKHILKYWANVSPVALNTSVILERKSKSSKLSVSLPSAIKPRTRSSSNIVYSEIIGSKISIGSSTCSTNKKP